MNQISTLIKKITILAVVAIQLFGLSALNLSPLVLADDTAASTSGAAASSSSCPDYNGTDAPTGSAAHTFTFDTASCLWENDYYTWDPATKIYEPKYSTAATYNPSTNTYDQVSWNYSAAKGAYVKSVTSTPATSSAPAAAATSSPTSTSTAAGTTGGDQSNWTGSATIDNTGANSNNSIQDNSTTDADITINNSASILTTVDATAVSGNALVMNNTVGGNATSGNADNLANVINMLQSSWDPLKKASTFNANVYGNYTGDLLFNPASILNTGDSSSNDIADNSSTDLTVNINETGLISNDINLDSRSGDATVSGNTFGGDALSGDATAVANIVNMINSAIKSDGSFFGSINLYGTLDGDILLPPGLMAEIAKTGNSSSNTITDNSDTNVNANITNNSSITNNTNLAAQSGAALVDGNTVGGDATTGSAETNLNEMNLIGQKITGVKGLLVLVNVAGKWKGLIFGGSSGLSNIFSTGANSNNSIADNSTTNANLNINRDNQIINNLNLSAVSGNATVNGNTNGGDARSGDAVSTVNMLNMIDSEIDFSDWFGVLFINVLGSWYGSFGVDTGAGGKGGGSVDGAATSNNNSSNLPRASTGLISSAVASVFSGKGVSSTAGQVNASGAGLTTQGDSKKTDNRSAKDVVKNVASSKKAGLSFWLTAAVVAIVVLFLTGDTLWAFLGEKFGRK